MLILAVNAGSSSLKYQLVDATGETERRVAGGVVERVTDHEAAVGEMLDRVRKASTRSPDAIGHRIVHGGPHFVAPTLLDATVVSELQGLTELAPLHNGPGVAAVRACRRAFGDALPMVAVFDTAFHAALPDVASRYAIPADVTARHAIRRYGFHGISYAYIVARHARLARRSPDDVKMIALHLGNGCSIAAIRGGRSVDTSMGFTPLEGLVMGTRSGDLDPAIVSYLARRERISVEHVEQWLNERSGLLGLSGLSHDVRDLLAAEQQGDARAGFALEVFCYRIRKYIGAYLAVLGGADAVIFGGGIGEHAPAIRARVCDGMDWCGLALDQERNEKAVGLPAGSAARISRMPRA